MNQKFEDTERRMVGAMPGRIVDALRKVKVRNPLMLLDEIDKTGKDQRGVQLCIIRSP